MTEYTKGPWRNTPDTGEIADENGTYIARAILGSVTPQGKANARLIAAAPELLEALEEVIVRAEMSNNMRAQVMAAIAKAKGEGA